MSFSDAPGPDEFALERDVSFLADMMIRMPAGHTVPSEHERLAEIAGRFPRFAPRQDRETPEPDFPASSVAGDPERDADYQHAVRHADAQGYGDGQ